MNQSRMIVCSSEQKKRILQSLGEESSFFDGVFFSKKEFLEKYFFSYTNDTLIYLIHKYHWHLDVVRTYLKYLYVIDLKKKYKN